MARSASFRRLTRLGALSLAVAVGAGTAAAGTAGASGGHARKKGHHSALPAVRNATKLSAEPSVRGQRGKPPTKLLTKDLVTGTGATVTASSSVSVVYIGANWRTGKDFTASTWQTHQPVTFPLSGVVPGFAQGLVGMKVGGRREIVIPPALGYGKHGGGPIKPNETLVFVVDLKGVSG